MVKILNRIYKNPFNLALIFLSVFYLSSYHIILGKTLEAFLEGDKALQQKLNRVIHSDNDDDGEEDITLKSERGYDVVLKGNNKNKSNSNNVSQSDDGEDGGYSFDHEDDASCGDNSGYDEDDDEVNNEGVDERNDASDGGDSDGSYKAP